MIYISDQLEILCGKLAQNIARTEDDSDTSETVFLPEILITQTAGMESWLSTELARRNGVFANFRFLKQDQLLEEIYSGLYGKKRYTTNMRPALYELLGSESFITRFPDIAAYYSKEKHNSQLRRMQLAGKMADLFDQYQVYRTDMMSAWEAIPASPPDRRKETIPAGRQDTDHEAWQRWLWNSLRKNHTWFCPKHQMQAWLLEKLEDPQNWPAVREMVPRVSLFGLSIFTTFHNQVLEKLARIIDVDYYLVFPSEQFIENKSFTNPLSASLGVKYAEMAAMLPREWRWCPCGDSTPGKRFWASSGTHCAGTRFRYPGCCVKTTWVMEHWLSMLVTHRCVKWKYFTITSSPLCRMEQGLSPMMCWCCSPMWKPMPRM